LLSGDTTVAAGRRILGQPETPDQHRAFLRLLSGRRHHVMSAVCVVDAAGNTRIKLSDSIVKFKPLQDGEIERYLTSGEGKGKAGGYAIQGLAEAYVTWMSGSYSGIMVLPLYETRNLLMAAGLKLA